MFELNDDKGENVSNRLNSGRVGLYLSLVAPATIVLMALLQPGWGSPITALGGLAILLTPPIALIVSIVAWVRNANRFAAMAGTVISGLIILLFFFGLLLSLCR